MTSYSLPDGQKLITATELRLANRNIQMEVMRTWFYSNYADPAEETPYESAEGGYIYIWGGPYEPLEELQNEFDGLVPDQVIEQLSNELCEITDEWTCHSDYEYDYVDDYLFESIAKTPDHKSSFDEFIANVESLLHLEVTSSQQMHLLKLLYANVITAVETYLSDLFISAVSNDETVLRRFVETTDEFKKQKFALSEVFKEASEIKKKSRSHLMSMTWHNLKKVKPMFEKTLDISFPDNKDDLFKAILIRHDIVHRNGKKLNGGEHDISEDTVESIIKLAKSFVANLDKQWAEGLERKRTDANDFSFDED